MAFKFEKMITLRPAIAVVTCLYWAKGRNIIDQEDFDVFYNDRTEIVKMIQALRKTL